MRTVNALLETSSIPRGKFKPGGEKASSIDVTKITVEAITDLNENGGEANVATGYHAIEFLLWGQDQDYGNFMEDKVTPGAMTAGRDHSLILQPIHLRHVV